MYTYFFIRPHVYYIRNENKIIIEKKTTISIHGMAIVS